MLPTSSHRLPRVGASDVGRRLLVLLAASYGVFHFSYKFLLPSLGVGDSDYYYPLYRAPLNFHAGLAPFVLRQVSIVLTWLAWQSHIFYFREIAFNDPKYDQRIFFAALLVNFLSLVLAALAAGLIAEELLGRRDSFLALMAALLCLFTFHAQSVVITNGVEGPAWALLGFAFLALLRRSYLWMAVLLLLATFEREMVLIAVGCLAASQLLPLTRPLLERRNRYPLFAMLASLVCCGLYVVLRHHYEEYGFQAEPSSLSRGILKFRFDRELLFQGILSQNILLLAVVAAFAWRPNLPALWFWMSRTLVAFLVLVLVSLAAYEGNNAGRLAGVLTPIFAALAALALQQASFFTRTPVTGAAADGAVQTGTTLGARSSWSMQRATVVVLLSFILLGAALFVSGKVYRKLHPKLHPRILASRVQPAPVARGARSF